MTSDDRLQRSTDFLRLLRGRVESGEFGSVKVCHAVAPDVVFERYRKQLDETDKEPEAWRVVVTPRTGEPRGASVGGRFFHALLARVEAGEFTDIVLTQRGSILDYRMARTEADRERIVADVNRFVRAAERGLVEYTQTQPTAWTVVAIPKKTERRLVVA